VNDDAQLIDEALAGQAGAFGRLVTKYQDRLYNTLVHALGCHEEARDVAQEAFVQAMLKLRSFQRQSAFYTWLYRIAFNLASSRRRRRRASLSLDQAR
jgi:RNA polymerase sigma-70 factor (ECF subfamily)